MAIINLEQLGELEGRKVGIIARADAIRAVERANAERFFKNGQEAYAFMLAMRAALDKALEGR